jgi:hypothetical protein
MKGRLLEIGFSLWVRFLYGSVAGIRQPRTIFKTKTVPKYYLMKRNTAN